MEAKIRGPARASRGSPAAAALAASARRRAAPSGARPPGRRAMVTGSRGSCTRVGGGQSRAGARREGNHRPTTRAAHAPGGRVSRPPAPGRRAGRAQGRFGCPEKWSAASREGRPVPGPPDAAIAPCRSRSAAAVAAPPPRPQPKTTPSPPPRTPRARDHALPRSRPNARPNYPLTDARRVLGAGGGGAERTGLPRDGSGRPRAPPAPPAPRRVTSERPHHCG